jgi:hypothetical protein
MFVTAAITLVCTAGVSFCVRFLVALCQECRPHRISSWVRRHTREEEIAGRQERQSQWLTLPENGLNSHCCSSRSGSAKV